MTLSATKDSPSRARSVGRPRRLLIGTLGMSVRVSRICGLRSWRRSGGEACWRAGVGQCRLCLARQPPKERQRRPLHVKCASDEPASVLILFAL